MTTTTTKEWRETTLDAEINLLSGGTPKTSVKEYWDGDIPWLSVADFNNPSRWVRKAEKSISDSGLQNSATTLLESGDLIISARGTVGALAQVKSKMAFNQSCYGIRAKDTTTNDFLYYLIKSKLKEVQRKVHGAVFDTITRETFHHIEVVMPGIGEQKMITAVLSVLDEKIDLLEQQNGTLEQIAQAIFNEWFGRHNVSDKIPDGWKTYLVSEIADVVPGYSYKGADLVESSEAGLVNLKNFDRNGGFKISGLKPITGSPKAVQEVHIGDVVVAHTDITQDAEVLGNAALRAHQLTPRRPA